MENKTNDNIIEDPMNLEDPKDLKDDNGTVNETGTEEDFSLSQDAIDDSEELVKKNANYNRRYKFLMSIGIVALLTAIIVFVVVTLKKSCKVSKKVFSREEPSAKTIENLIHSKAIFGGEEFKDKDTYQFKALNWIVTDADGKVGCDEECIVQRYALACFYYSTYNVEHMYTEYHFKGGKVKPWVDASKWMSHDSECQWFGVECDSDSDAVKGLNLPENNLSGSLPREITLLKSLEHLDVGQNALFNYGAEGNDWLGDMTAMKHLYYGGNYFDYDGLPTSLSKLTSLQQLDCSYTLYFGQLKEEVFKGLDELEYVVISGNKYDGSLPTSLLTLPALEFLYAEDTSITGTLDFISDLKDNLSPMIEFWLSNNKLEGTIPLDIGRAMHESLLSLSLSTNMLSGPIPSEMGQLTGLEKVWLYNNELTGTIPDEMSTLTNLRTFFAMGNQLTGSVPDDMCAIESINQDHFVVDCEEDSGIICNCCRGNCDFFGSA